MVTDAAQAVRSLLKYIGENPDREGLLETPSRVVRSYDELFAGYVQDPAELFKVFDSDGYDEMIVVRGVNYQSVCEHHMLPVEGIATVGYIPNGKVIGLSKLARLVDIFARRLQLQERMTIQITNCIEEHLQPKGAGCVLQARHLCLSCRGARKENASMITSSLTGVFKSDQASRAEFLSLALPK